MENRRFIGKINNQVAYLYRVDKRKARAFFAMGSNVYLVPDQLDPFNDDLKPLPVNQENGNFDNLSANFRNYFCLNSNTGYFPAYYINLYESTLKFPKNEIHI